MIEKASFKVTVLGAVDGGEGVQLHHLQLLLTLAKHLLVAVTSSHNYDHLMNPFLTTWHRGQRSKSPLDVRPCQHPHS